MILNIPFVSAQQNELTLDLKGTDFTFVNDADDQQYTSALLDINEDLNEREVVKVLKDDSGLLWIIQRHVVHAFDGKSILESHYFDQQNGGIYEAFFRYKRLVLLSNKQAIGILDLINKQDKKIHYFDFPKNHALQSVVDNNLFSLALVGPSKNIIYKADLSNYTDLTWTTLTSIESTRKITAFNYDESSEDVVYINEQDDLIHCKGDEIIKLNVEKRDDVFIPTPKLIKYKNGYFVFFNNAQGLFWYDNQNTNTSDQLFPLTSKGNYQYHNYDQNESLLIGIDIKPKVVNTVLQITGDAIQYKNHDLDFNTTYDVLSEDFNREQILSGGNGIYRVSNNEELVPGIMRYLYDPNKQTVEYGEIVTDVTEHLDRVYAVSESSRSVFSLSENTFETIYKDKNLLFHKLSSDLVNNVLWISAYNEQRHGSLFALQDSTIKRIIDTDIIIRKVIPVGKNEILLFGFRLENRKRFGVIYSLNIDTKILKEIFTKENFDIWCAAIINEKILCGTNHTLFEFDRQSQNIKEVESLRTQMVSSIRQYDDTIFVCTRSNGVYVLNQDYSLLKHLDFSQQAISNKVTDIRKDKNKNYWLTTFKGIALLNQDFKFLMRLTPRDGISSSEFNSFASTTNGDDIYFGSINGITKINTEQFYHKADNAAKIYNVKATYKNRIHSAINEQKSFTFEFVPDHIVFESYFDNVASSLPNYSAIEMYHNNTQVPIDQSKHVIRVPNLSKGVYEVFQRNLKNEKVKLAVISISPNYSALFRNILLAGCIALIGFLFARFINYREKKLLVEKNELENRLVEIKLESLRSQLNPHFVFNCLNSIQYYIQMNEKVLARDYLSKFSKLMRYFLESSRNDKISITEEINLLTLYLELEKLRFENKFDYNISNSTHGDFKIPTMILQPHVENSIVHGISHLEDRKGKIDISFISVENGVMCSISDNGIGREAAEVVKLTKRNNHKSRATQIIKERMDILNNQGKGNAKIYYQDKKDMDGKVEGTITDITFVTY